VWVDDVFSCPGSDATVCQDDEFVPFEHTIISKYGPISRLAKISVSNAGPVQVTAAKVRLTPTAFHTVSGSFIDGSSIATITVLEESPEPILLFQCHILCHVYNKFMYNLLYFCNC